MDFCGLKLINCLVEYYYNSIFSKKAVKLMGT